LARWHDKLFNNAGSFYGFSEAYRVRNANLSRIIPFEGKCPIKNLTASYVQGNQQEIWTAVKGNFPLNSYYYFINGSPRGAQVKI
jgi:hypothetical protein